MTFSVHLFFAAVSTVIEDFRSWMRNCILHLRLSQPCPFRNRQQL